MYESVIAKKLRLRANFLKTVLHTRQNAVGIELVHLETVITILASKFHIGNLRADTKVSKLIRLNKEALIVEYGKGKIEEYKIRILLNNTI